MFQMCEDRHYVDYEVAAKSGEHTQQRTNVRNPEGTTQREDIDEYIDYDISNFAWLLCIKEQTKDQIVQEVGNEWIS